MFFVRLWDVSCGMLLAAAGLLKTLVSGEYGATAAGRASIPGDLGCVAAIVEVMLGVGLVAGLQLALLRPIVGVLYAAFAAYSLHQALAGFEHCGCFGALSVPPWLTALVDIVAATGLLLLPGESWLRRSRTVRLGAAVALAIALPMFWTRLSWMPWVSATLFGNNAAESIVVLSPADWIGKPLPTAASIPPPV